MTVDKEDEISCQSDIFYIFCCFCLFLATTLVTGKYENTDCAHTSNWSEHNAFGITQQHQQVGILIYSSP